MLSGIEPELSSTMTTRHAKPARPRVRKPPGLESRLVDLHTEIANGACPNSSLRADTGPLPASLSSAGAARLGCLPWRGVTARPENSEKASAKTAAFFYE